MQCSECSARCDDDGGNCGCNHGFKGWQLWNDTNPDAGTCEDIVVPAMRGGCLDATTGAALSDSVLADMVARCCENGPESGRCGAMEASNHSRSPIRCAQTTGRESFHVDLGGALE